MNAMRYKPFGRSGLRVSELSLGALTFGEEGGQGADKKESEKVFRAYVERGGTQGLVEGLPGYVTENL